MHHHQLIAEALIRYRYRGRGAGGQVFYYLFRWLYSVIGAWAFAVEGGFIALCLGVSAWARGGQP